MTAVSSATTPTAAPTGLSGRTDRVPGPLRGFVGGIIAVAARDLRGRMRSRRTFLVITVYLLLLAGFAFGIYAYLQRQAEMESALRLREMVESGSLWGVAPGFAHSARIGHQLFSGLMLLQTILILVLAPAFTAGVISSERERQTLDLLVTTPLSTVGLVVGKLFAALLWVFVLILASVPVMALVFVFGAVGPDDVLRGYALLVTLAFGMGAVGLFLSAICRRTQTATVLASIVVLVIALGSIPAHALWGMLGTETTRSATGVTTIKRTSRAPEQLLWLNPFAGVADLVCTTAPGGYDAGTCDYVASVTNRPFFGGARAVTDDVFFRREPMPVPFPGNVVIDDVGWQVQIADWGGGLLQVGDGPAIRLDDGGVMPLDLVGGMRGGFAIEVGADGPGIEVRGLMDVADEGAEPEGGIGAVLRGLLAPLRADEPPVRPEAEPVADQAAPSFGYPRDTLWTRNALAFLVLGLVLTLLSTQLVAPTRRLRLRRRSGPPMVPATATLTTPAAQEVQP
ncbi:MAG: ABC transporter permease [Chloroflexi bacterium]|nr:ABC transporter permease [Chloroflexota bacterium]